MRRSVAGASDASHIAISAPQLGCGLESSAAAQNAYNAGKNRADELMEECRSSGALYACLLAGTRHSATQRAALQPRRGLVAAGGSVDHTGRRRLHVVRHRGWPQSLRRLRIPPAAPRSWRPAIAAQRLDHLAGGQRRRPVDRDQRRRHRVPQRAHRQARGTGLAARRARPAIRAQLCRATASAGSGSPRATQASPFSTRAPANCSACDIRPRSRILSPTTPCSPSCSCATATS